MAISTLNTSLVFSVQRREPELIKPVSPTPNELKLLSDIDDQEGVRFHLPFVLFYPCNPSMEGKDPVKVIKEGLSKALVFYYPLAGRLREGYNRKLVVECNGEGVLFIEADANVSLDQFGDSLQPPFPCFEELLFDVPGSGSIVNCPLLLIQVTRLLCGGFIVAIRFNHTMVDGFGLVNFMSAVAEMARLQRKLPTGAGFLPCKDGIFAASLPSILPVWERHLLNARDAPRMTCIHHAFEGVNNHNSTILATNDLVHASVFFGATEISRLRKLVPPSLPYTTTFELLTACLWKCRSIAVQFNPSEEIRMIFLVNIRNRADSPLPKGYYGNGFALTAAVATAGDVACKPFGYALELLKKAKADVTMEYMQSQADLMVIKDSPHFTLAGSYVISDVTRIGFETVDFGWGKAVYGGPSGGGVGVVPGYISFLVPFKNKKGEKGVVVPISLPKQAMKRFEVELEKMLGA